MSTVPSPLPQEPPLHPEAIKAINRYLITRISTALLLFGISTVGVLWISVQDIKQSVESRADKIAENTVKDMIKQREYELTHASIRVGKLESQVQQDVYNTVKNISKIEEKALLLNKQTADLEKYIQEAKVSTEKASKQLLDLKVELDKPQNDESVKKIVGDLITRRIEDIEKNVSMLKSVRQPLNVELSGQYTHPKGQGGVGDPRGVFKDYFILVSGDYMLLVNNSQEVVAGLRTSTPENTDTFSFFAKGYGTWSRIAFSKTNSGSMIAKVSIVTPGNAPDEQEWTRVDK